MFGSFPACLYVCCVFSLFDFSIRVILFRLDQGSYRSWKTGKVMGFEIKLARPLKVMGFPALLSPYKTFRLLVRQEKISGFGITVCLHVCISVRADIEQGN